MNRPLRRLLRRQTSLSPATGSASAKPRRCAQALIVGAARDVAADQHLIGVDARAGDRDRRARTTCVSPYCPASSELPARISIDSRTIGLSCACRCTSVSMASGSAFGEEAAALDRRQLRGIAEHQQRHAERHQVAPELGIDHRAFVDDDQLGLGGGRVVQELEGRRLLAALARPVDQAVDGGGAVAALAAHHAGGLAGEGREQNLAVDALGDVLGERGLAGAGIAEQAEDRRPLPRAVLNQSATAVSAASWWGVKTGMRGPGSLCHKEQKGNGCQPVRTGRRHLDRKILCEPVPHHAVHARVAFREHKMSVSAKRCNSGGQCITPPAPA